MELYLRNVFAYLAAHIFKMKACLLEILLRLVPTSESYFDQRTEFKHQKCSLNVC